MGNWSEFGRWGMGFGFVFMRPFLRGHFGNPADL